MSNLKPLLRRKYFLHILGGLFLGVPLYLVGVRNIYVLFVLYVIYCSGLYLALRTTWHLSTGRDSSASFVAEGTIEEMRREILAKGDFNKRPHGTREWIRHTFQMAAMAWLPSFILYHVTMHLSSSIFAFAVLFVGFMCAAYANPEFINSPVPPFRTTIEYKGSVISMTRFNVSAGSGRLAKRVKGHMIGYISDDNKYILGIRLVDSKAVDVVDLLVLGRRGYVVDQERIFKNIPAMVKYLSKRRIALEDGPS